MLSRARAVAAKDLRLVLSGGQGLAQAVLLGLLLIFVFSLSRPAGELVPPQAAAAVFWLATAFGLVLIFGTLYGLEEGSGARQGLLLSPAPPASIWLGKAVAGLFLLLLSQLVFAPAAMIFLGQSPAGGWLPVLSVLAAADWGLVVLGSLLGALSQGQAARDSLLSVILFPLLVPVLLAGIRVGAVFLTDPAQLGPDAASEAMQWLGLACAFDALFTGAAMLLFPFVFTGDD